MFAVYLELAVSYILNTWVAMILLTTTMFMGLGGLVYIFVQVIIDDGKWNSDFDIEECMRKVSKVALKIGVIIFTISVVTDSVLMFTSRDFAIKVQETKVKYGIEDYHLVITDGDGDVVFEKIGYFEYYKELNQVYVTDLITKKVEIFTIEDGMKLNVDITNGGE